MIIGVFPFDILGGYQGDPQLVPVPFANSILKILI